MELVASICISLGVALLTLVSFIIARGKDVKTNALEQGKLIQTLAELVTTTNKIDCKTDVITKDITELRERIVRVEESTKAGHRRMDEHIKKEG